MTQTITPDTSRGDPVLQEARLLTVGDRIAAGFLPHREAAEIVFVHHYTIGDQPWVFAAYALAGGWPDSDYFLADARIPLTVMADAFGYSREADDDPTPVSPARVPLHTGSVVDGDLLVTDGGAA